MQVHASLCRSGSMQAGVKKFNYVAWVDKGDRKQLLPIFKLLFR